MKLSILIPVFGKWGFTASILKDLSHLDPSEVEIIVIDNASPDNTLCELQNLKSNMSNLVIISNNKNMGFGFAINQGYKISKSQYVMILNNDVRVKDNYKSWAFDMLEHCTDSNLVGPTGGKVDITNDFQFCYETNDPTKEINYLSGWCMAGKKSVWAKLDTTNDGDIFDVAFFCYFEDTDLSFRAKLLKIDLSIVNIPVVHFGKVSSKQLNVFDLYTKARVIFSKRWKLK